MELIPEGLARATVEREGEAGRRWLAQLPDVVADFSLRWGFRLDGPPWHGGVALVLPVITAQGPAVLKLLFPHPGNVGEALALRTFDGRGAVRLFEASEDGLVLLLERAGGQTLATLPAVEDRIEIAGELARRLAVPAPAEATSLASTCAGWLDQLDQQLSAHPDALPSRAVERARATITHLADDRTPTMLHGDLHDGNVLRAEREPWLVIDPKGWSGTAAFDAFTVAAAGDLAGVADVERDFRDRVYRFAVAAEVDHDLALACCQARAVSSYLYQLDFDHDWFIHDLLAVLIDLD